MHDEGDAAVEFVEALRLAERVLAGLLGEIARQLAADDPQEIEILPVEGTGEGRAGQHDHAEQALLHLVQNSVEASPEGGAVVLDARVDGLDVVIEVMDSGTGMSPEFVRSHLFKPFHSSKPGGFGIGAFEARETIRAMGGNLEVESREGLGTRFLVRLPRVGTREASQSGNDVKTKVA